MSDPSGLPPRVLKFGGTSVASSRSLTNLVAIVAEARRERPVVVVASALAGITDLLKDAVALALDRPLELDAKLEELRERHRQLLGEMADPWAVEEAWQRLGRVLTEVEGRLRAAARQGADRAAQAAILATGERLSVPIVAAALASNGTPATPVDAAELIVTDSGFLEAEVDRDATFAAVRGQLDPASTVPVVTGFLGADRQGRTTLLGRGSSDTSATWLGAALGAERVEIWTDVDGVLSADPRLVPSARRLPQLSYEQAADLAAFGAKVLHARAMAPVAGLGIPVCVRNTFAPGAAGTHIGPRTTPFDPTAGPEAEPPQRGLAACRPPWLRGGLAVLALIGADDEPPASLREELHEALLAVGIRPVGTGTSERGGVAVLAAADLERAVPAVHDRLILGLGARSRRASATAGHESAHVDA